MNILITGGAGFISSHLAKKPLKEDYEVKVPHNPYLGFIKNLCLMKTRVTVRIIILIFVIFILKQVFR